MAGNCFICENSLSVGETVNVERGLQTLKNASNERDDGHLEFLNNVTSVTVHVECRKEYTHKKKLPHLKENVKKTLQVHVTLHRIKNDQVNLIFGRYALFVVKKPTKMLRKENDKNIEEKLNRSAHFHLKIILLKQLSPVVMDSVKL